MFIDVHTHAYKRPYPGVDGKPVFSTPEQVIVRFDELGIEKGCILPIVNSEVYLPQSNEEILEMCEKYPDRFIPFCNIDPRAITNSVDAPLDYILSYYKDLGCKGIGEVMPSMPFMHPKARNLFKHCQSVGLPLTFDISDRLDGDYGFYDEPGLPQLQDTLRSFPKLTIVCHGPAFWAEIGKLELPGDRVGYPSYPISEEGAVPKMMRRYENMWCDLSAGSGYFAMARDPEYAAAFLNEFADKLMYGTDICAHDQQIKIGSLLIELRDSGKLSEEKFNKIARENAIRLYGL